MPTCLDAANYDSREDAPSGSWYVERVGTGDGSGFEGSCGFEGGSDGQEKKEKEKQTCKRRKNEWIRWTQEEEAKLKEAKLKGEKWKAIAEELGTGRTPGAVKEHWKLMNKKQKRQGRAQVEEQDEALDAGSNESSEEEVDVVDLPAEDAVSEVHQVVEVTASAQPPEQQTRACELVLVPLGDDAREEVSRSVEPHAA